MNLRSRARVSRAMGLVSVFTMFAVAAFGQTSPAPTGTLPNIVKIWRPAKVQASSQTPAASTSGKHPQTPFQRFLKPLLEKSNAARANASTGGQRLQSMGLEHPQVQNLGGTSVNFPGFAAPPFLQISDDTGSPMAASVSADFNKDGHMDVAAVENNGALHVILNPGSMAQIASTSALPVNRSYTGYVSIAWLTAIDMNGDGNLDLVGQDIATSKIVVWQGNGDGTFQSPQIYSVSPTSGAMWDYGGYMLVGDFNGDGAPDVVAITLNPSYNNGSFVTGVTVQTFLNANDGSGALHAPSSEIDVTFNDFYEANFGQAAIVTADGAKPSEIAFILGDHGMTVPANSGIDIITMASHGDGTFAVPVEPSSAVVADGGLNVTGSFYATDLRTKGAALVAGGGTPTADLVFMTGDGAVYDEQHQAGGTLTAPLLLVGANQYLSNPGGTPIPGEQVMNLGDLDGDGYLDLLVRTVGNAIIYRNGGNAGFTADPIEIVGGKSGSEEPEPADFDGSGRQSFVWADTMSAQVAFYQNLGTSSASRVGQFYAAPSVSGSTTAGGSVYSAFSKNISVQASVDINGDGLLDVIAIDQTNASANGGYPDLVVGINNASGSTNAFSFTMGLPAATLSTLGGGFEFIEPLTIPSSSGPSILIATGNGLYISTINAAGAFSTPAPLNLGTGIACALSLADVGDVNGDGLPDIVVAYGGDAACSGSTNVPSGFFTLLGAGGSSFQTATFTPFGQTLYQPRLAAFGTPGGTLDLALSDNDYNNQQFAVYVLAGNGDGTFNTSNWRVPVTNYVISDIIPGDYNSDGYQDLTLATAGEYIPGYGETPDSSGVLLVAGKGQENFGTPLLIAPPNNYESPVWGTYADFNGDGNPDLVLTEFSYGPTQMVRILPGLGGGNFGPSVYEFDAPTTSDEVLAFTGNFGNSGGTDLMVATTGDNNGIFLNQGADQLQLAISPSAPVQGSPITFTASLVSSVNTVAATGTVTFSDGRSGTVLGTAPLVNGVATFSTSNFGVGFNVVAATYSGDGTHNPTGTGNGFTVTAVPPSFTVSPASGSFSVTAGATGVMTLNIAANPTFSGTVNLSCAGGPAEASCAINPAAVTLTPSQTGQVSLVLATTPENNQYSASNRMGMVTGLHLALAGLALLLVPRRRRFTGLLAILLVSVLSLTMLSGCSSGTPPAKYPGTPAGTYTLTVSANSGTITQTQTVTLTVTAQ